MGAWAQSRVCTQSGHGFSTTSGWVLRAEGKAEARVLRLELQGPEADHASEARMLLPLPGSSVAPSSPAMQRRQSLSGRLCFLEVRIGGDRRGGEGTRSPPV